MAAGWGELNVTWKLAGGNKTLHGSWRGGIKPDMADGSGTYKVHGISYGGIEGNMNAV